VCHFACSYSFLNFLSFFPFCLANEHILLSATSPEANGGMLVLRGEGIRVKNSDQNKGDFVVDALTIYRPLDDVKDFLNKRIKAQLLSDGSGIEVTWPALPDYFRDFKKIQALEGRDVCERTQLRHSTFVSSFKNDDARHLKKIILHFPDQMTCNSNHFNAGKEHGQLKTVFRMAPASFKLPDFTPDPDNPDDDDTVHYLQPFVYWKVVINKKVTEQVAHESTAVDETKEDVLGAVRLFRNLGV
jgi:hypothetical protein